jgi:hypothetical protein
MIADQKENRFKKLLAVGLVMGFIVLTSNSIKLENSIANAGNFKTLTPVATAEDIYESNHWNQSIISEYYDAINPNDIGKYLYIGLPSDIGLKGDYSSPQNNGRADFYKIENIPSWAWEGKVHEYSTDTAGLQIIKKELVNVNQFAKIELSYEQEGFYTVKVTGTDDRINNKSILMNAIVLKDEVNCDNNKDGFRTRILKRVAYQYAFEKSLGMLTKVQNGKSITQNFDIDITKYEQAKCKILVFGQDRTTGEMYFSGYTDMVDGKAALFNIDNLPSATLDLKDIAKYTNIDKMELEMFNKPEYREKIGYEKKAISVTDAKDLKYLSLQLDYTATEAQIYQVLTAGLNPELKDKATLKYNKEKNQVDVTFADPINGDKLLFYFYIKINKATTEIFPDENGNGCKSVNFKFREFYAYDSNHNLIKYDLRDQKTCFPVRMCTIPNPSDFNGDTNLNSKDLALMFERFGTRKGDILYDPKFNVDDTGVKDRIDLLDVLKLNQEISEQEKLQKEIYDVKKMQTSSPGFQKAYSLSKDQKSRPFHFFRKQLYCLECD